MLLKLWPVTSVYNSPISNSPSPGWFPGGFSLSLESFLLLIWQSRNARELKSSQGLSLNYWQEFGGVTVTLFCCQNVPSGIELHSAYSSWGVQKCKSLNSSPFCLTFNFPSCTSQVSRFHQSPNVGICPWGQPAKIVVFQGSFYLSLSICIFFFKSRNNIYTVKS